MFQEVVKSHLPHGSQVIQEQTVVGKSGKGYSGSHASLFLQDPGRLTRVSPRHPCQPPRSKSSDTVEVGIGNSYGSQPKGMSGTGTCFELALKL
jgi:hypothetical protein